MHKYKLLGRKGEGTFSEVLKAQSIKTGKFMAIKCMKHVFESIEQVNSLREIQALRRLSPHPNIVKLHEVLYDQPTGRLALVFELMDCNIYELIKGRTHYLPEETVKIYMYQLMKAVDHMHRHGIFHRDIKPENLLIVDNMLKLADFGSCRGIYSKQPYTEYISTRWYRAPECLLTDGYYGYKMDLWGVGCVMFETLALYPLFPGTNEADQIERIHKISGTPSGEILEKFKHYGSTHVDFNFNQYKRHPLGLAKLLPHVSPDAIDLMHKLLLYDPDERMTAREALRHPWFAELRAAEKRQREAAKARKSGSNGTEGENKEGDDNDGKDNGESNNNRSKDDEDHHSSADSAVDSPGNIDKQKAHKEGGEKKSKDAEVSTVTNLAKELSPTKEVAVGTNGGIHKSISSSHSGNSGGKSGGGMNSNARNPGGLIAKDNTGATLQYQIQGMKITGAPPSKSGGDNNNPKLSTKPSQSTSTNPTKTSTDNVTKQSSVKRKDNDTTLYENNTNGIEAGKSLYGNSSSINNAMRSPQGNNLQSASVISYAGTSNSNVMNGTNATKGTNNKGPGGLLYGNPSGVLSPQGSNPYLSNGMLAANVPNPSLLNNNNVSPTLGRNNKYGPSATNVIAAAKSEIIGGVNGGASLYGMPMNNSSNNSGNPANIQNINGLFKPNTMLSPGNPSGVTNPLLLPGGAGRQPNTLLSPQQLATNPLLGSPMGLMPNTMNNSLSYGSNTGVQVLSPQPGNNNALNPLLLQHQQLQQMNLSPLRGNVPLNPGLYGAMNNPAAAALVAAQQQAALAAASVSNNANNNSSGNSNKYSTNNSSMKSKNSSSSTNQLLSPQYAGNANKYASSSSSLAASDSKNRSSNTNVPSFQFEQPSLYARRPEEKAGTRNNNLGQHSGSNMGGSSSGPSQQLAFNNRNTNNSNNVNGRNNSNNDQFNRISGTSASGGSGTKPSNATNNNSSSNISNHLKRASDIYITGNKSSTNNTNSGNPSNNNLSSSSVYDANGNSSTGKNNNSNVRNTNNTTGNGSSSTNPNTLLYGSSIPNNNSSGTTSNGTNNNLLVNYLGNPPPPGGYSLYGNNVSTNTNPSNTYAYGNGTGITGGVSLYGASVDNANSSGKWDVPRRRPGDKVRTLAPLYASPTSISTNAVTGTATTNPAALTNANRSTNVSGNGTNVSTVTNTNQPLTVNTGTVLSPLQQNSSSSRYLSPYSQKVGEAKRF